MNLIKEAGYIIGFIAGLAVVVYTPFWFVYELLMAIRLVGRYVFSMLYDTKQRLLVGGDNE